MSLDEKELSNPFSTGGGGVNFETRVQTAFLALMVTRGFSPCLPLWPITKIKLQGKYEGYDIDDLIVFAESPGGDRSARLIGQIKHSISITQGDKVFGEVIQAAWSNFNNPKTFREGNDAIALITGPLSATDITDVRTILEWARHSEDAADFTTKVGQANFSSDSKRKKLKAFKHHLKRTNGSMDVSDDKLWRFMKSFYLLGYDLDVKAGITLSLLQSLIGQYSQENARALWLQLMDEVQSANQNAGTIKLDSLPEDLKSAFKKKVIETIPADFTRPLSVPVAVDWSKVQYASELAVATLIGSWDENFRGDRPFVEQLTGENYDIWISKMREILQHPESPLTLRNGQWAVVKRLEMWQQMGPRLFDEHLDRFRQGAVQVLAERDPQFEMPTNERYAASIYGKVLTHSYSLRKGLADSLALLGSNPNALINCSVNKAEKISALVVRELLGDTAWVLWASLNSLLPLLAEAAPTQFLEAVEAALQSKSCPFNELFAQEGNGLTGGNYMTGLLWALEGLAWDEKYLALVTVILGELGTLDPGGNWANRPANSLTTIFLPWLPQTTATVEKRKVAIKTLQKEVPEVSWKILLALLPNQHQISTGSHKPIWRSVIPEDWRKEVSQTEYWDQVSFYAYMAITTAKSDLQKLTDLVKRLDEVPEPAFGTLLAHLESDGITALPEGERFPLWNELVDFAAKHRRYADAEWALPMELVEKIDKIAQRLAPESPVLLYRRLFSGRDFDLYEEAGDWAVQQEKLDESRRRAIQTILTMGLAAIIEFAEAVESPWHVGLSLGRVADDTVDLAILPELLLKSNKQLLPFVSGFVWGRCQSQGWGWVDQLDTSSWSTAQKGQFLAYLPFSGETWQRSERLLGADDAEYWTKATVTPYQTEGGLELAIDKLMAHGRPNAALSCLLGLLHDKQPIDHPRAVKALLAAVSSSEHANVIDAYSTIEIIKALQADPNTNPDDLFRVEWAYLPLLDRHRGAAPKLLERRLASDPDFFCEVIRIVYRSTKLDAVATESTEQQKAIATNAFRLLREWRTPPGMLSDTHLNEWLDKVKAACSESGHLEVALSHIGNVLIHCSSDPDGLWINNAAAAALNANDAEKMRNGFRTGLFNARGVHCVDPTGKPEKELAAKYRKQADDVENHGYQRLAATLRDLADSYEREAERVILEHKDKRANEA
jgi:hypothetical protein